MLLFIGGDFAIVVVVALLLKFLLFYVHGVVKVAGLC